ncbi:MAG: CsoR family transcriptional regulator, copper-sensing transcriptional repressor [Thermotogota bacterium]|nr:CsoR family transcriptional regulator, copper-sensing transcriptional repressor [Thermotogota bacterium]MDK2865486.1 CsoR family transcriptional regulator, copper-sensing transcriptional repressor [Thermotogota bacterium]
MADTDPLIRRLRRIEGQVRGLQKMIEEKRACEDILTQINAVVSATLKVKEIILKDYTQKCVLEYEETGDKAKLDSLISTLIKYSGEGG